jgi:hypothetical protein
MIMKNQFKNSILFALLLLLPTFMFGQTLELRVLSTFEAYTGAGAITNSGTLTGDVGTNLGIISGSYTGAIHNNDSITQQARLDMLRIYIQLSNVFVTHPGNHAPVFGGGETITPGVYSIGGAGSISGNLTLNGGGNPNAYFIVKFEGALTIGASTTITLSNGTQACNVFWIAEGAISDAGSSVIKGSLYSHPGAITLGVNSTIEGRMFASEGAITTGLGSTSIAPSCNSSIPVRCSDGCTAAPTVDVLGSAGNFVLFTTLGAVANSATSGVFGDIGTNGGAVSGFGTSTQLGSIYTSDAVTAQASLDLISAYAQLMLIPNTVLGHTATFGSGETVNPGVYYIGGAGSLAGTITLNGQNNPNSVFIFKFNGAFSVAAQSKVILANGADRCNIFWLSQGATDMGTFTFMKGTVIANNGACSMAANGNLEGRMLSTGGAIGFSTGVAYNNPRCCVSAIPTLGGATTLCAGSTANVTPSIGGTWSSNNGNVTVTNAGAVTGVSSGSSTLTFTDNNSDCSSTRIVTVLNGASSAPSISCD